MQADFWHQRWQDNQIAFHEKRGNRMLVEHFGALGLSGEEAYAILGQADDQFELDKTGDALKELSIRATDMSTASVEAYEAMGLFAPNVNAYRRFSPDSFVPANRHWGENNRSVAFRVPRSEPGARRVEHRLAGADANPYLLMAALLAGAHHGLSERVDPGPPVTGNASARADPEMPDTLCLALARMRDAAVLPTYFGRRYWDAYVEVKSTEFESFMKRVFTREYDWYL